MEMRQRHILGQREYVLSMMSDWIAELNEYNSIMGYDDAKRVIIDKVDEVTEGMPPLVQAELLAELSDDLSIKAEAVRDEIN